MVLIGLVGKLGSGKDYIADNIVIPLFKEPHLKMAFADQIKINVMTKNNIPFNDVYVNKTEQSRTLLQQEGTEKGRDTINKNIWVDYLDNWIKIYKYKGVEHFIVSDVRFKNELEYIKNNGGILIKIVAPSRNHARLTAESKCDTVAYNKIKSHISECDLDDIPEDQFDMIIDNDTQFTPEQSILNNRKLMLKLHKIVSKSYKQNLINKIL
jgi:hypothetical protein